MILLLFAIVHFFVEALSWAIVLSCLMSMLIGFGVLDGGRPITYQIARFLMRVTEPVLAPVRNLLPQFGGFDFSPLVVLLVLQYIVEPGLFNLLMLIMR